MNLIICHTPLQMLIAERIIERFQDESFHLINYYFTDNPKRRYYYKKLSDRTIFSEEIFLPAGKSLFFQSFKNRLRFLGRHYDRVFLASIDSILCQAILSSICYDALLTFDDGSANLFMESMLYVENPSKKLKVIRKLLGLTCSLTTLRNESQMHFTIFDGPNIVEPLEKINLFSFERRADYLTKDEFSILLGQPIYYDDTERNLAYFSEVLQRYDFDAYFPHPRENYRLPNVEYIDTELIFEDYVSELLRQYRQLNIYTVSSSVVLSLCNIEGITIYAIPAKGYEEMQNMLASYGIRLLEGEIIC